MTNVVFRRKRKTTNLGVEFPESVPIKTETTADINFMLTVTIIILVLLALLAYVMNSENHDSGD